MLDLWNTSTNYNTTSINYANAGQSPGGPITLRITDDGTNLAYWVSSNGLDFFKCHGEARTTFLTATQWGFATYNYPFIGESSKTAFTDWVEASSVLGDAA
jgi:fermentation-respiration switch protein FrsA (DUF1100 family)